MDATNATLDAGGMLGAVPGGVTGDTLSDESPAPPASGIALANATFLTRNGRLKTPCKMSPMDEQRYFQTPQVSVVNLQFGNPVQIVGANSMRIALILAALSPTNDCLVCPDPDIASQGFGINLGQTGLQPLILDQERYGNLVQFPWYGFGGVNNFCTVIEVLLKEWPT